MVAGQCCVPPRMSVRYAAMKVMIVPGFVFRTM